MRELGDEAENYHRKMGQWLKKANLDKVFLFGEKNLIDYVLAEYPTQNAKYYESKDELNNDLAKILDEYKSQSTKLTVKGARSFKMEEVVAFVRQRNR